MKKMMLILVPLFILGTLLAAPLNEGFESATCPPSGWTIRYANPSPPSGNLMTHSTTYFYEGSRSFRFSSFSSGSPYDEYLITPQLVVTDEDKTVSFWYRKDTYGSEVFRVGWSSTGTEVADFTWSADITNASTTWQQYVKTDLPVGTKYVAVHYKSNYSYYLYIDAFVGPQIDVSAPPNPAILVYPADGGWAFLDDTLSWTSGGGIVDGYKLYISEDDIVNNDDFIIDQTGTTYTPDLEPGTTYYWKVVPHNEIGDAEGCPVWSFKTPTATQLAESFESTTFPPLGWKRTTTSTSYWTRSTSYSTHGIACMYAYTSTSTVYDISTPKCTISSGSTLNFSTRATSTSSKLQILYSTDRINWTQIGADISYTAANVWYNISIDLSDYAGEKYLAFRSPTQTSYSSIYVDAVFGPEITQAPPDPAVLVYPADGGWAFLDDTLSWTSGGGIVNGYNLYISDNDIVDDSDFIIDQTGTTYKLSDLEALEIEYGHTYYWKVVPYNNNGDAEGCPVWSFKTPTTTQLAESFENTTFPPTGWANPGTWSRNTYTIKHGIASAYKYGSTSSQYILSTPKVSITDDSTLDFWSNCSSTSGILQIVYSSDRTTWTQLGSNITFAATYTWYHNVIDLSSLAENNYYLGFRTAYSGSYYVDAVFGPEITSEAPEAPTLVSPADEAVNVSITPTFSWTAATTGGVPDGFKIYCGNPIDYDNPIATVSRTTTSYKIPGTNALEYETLYYWTVSAYKAGFEDARAAERSFTTMEDPTITTEQLPYTNGFEETWIGTPPAPGLGWIVVNANNDSYTWRQSPTYYIDPHTGDHIARGMGNTDDWLITPPIQASVDLRIKWWDAVESATYPNTYSVIVSTTDNSISSFTNNQGTFTCNNTDWLEHTLNLDEFTGNTIYVAFHQTASGSTWYDFGIDDFLIEAIPTEPILSYSPTSLDFGEVAFGVQVGPKTLTVTNTGSGVLALNKADNTQIIGSGFAIDDFDFSLAANESGQINVYANATQEGPFTATLRITYGTQQCDIALSATGLPAGVVVIGTGTEDLGLPIDTYYKYSYSQSIFLQSDIHIANRYIDKISFYWYAEDDVVNSNNWIIYMGNTDLTEFSDANSWISIDQLTPVFSGPVNLSAGERWIEITLESPFYHTNQNLVIAVDENAPGYDYNWSYDYYFYGTSTGAKGYRSISYNDDFTNPDPNNPPTSGSSGIAGFPNIKMQFEEEQPPLPVELTTFTAVISSDNLVEISWVTQTETGMVGYYVYRSSSESLDNAIAVSDMIEALNTAEQHTYKFIDSEIYDSGNYYYWLQTVDLAGSVSFHGPVSVYYTSAEDNPIPEIPKVTELRSIYPNPFNPVAFIPYSLAEESDAHFYIYNVKGQLLRHIYVGPQYPGYYQIRWDGKDINGKSCGSGVYYIIMKAGKQTFQRKAVLMK